MKLADNRTNLQSPSETFIIIIFHTHNELQLKIIYFYRQHIHTGFHIIQLAEPFSLFQNSLVNIWNNLCSNNLYCRYNHHWNSYPATLISSNLSFSMLCSRILIFNSALFFSLNAILLYIIYKILYCWGCPRNEAGKTSLECEFNSMTLDYLRILWTQ